MTEAKSAPEWFTEAIAVTPREGHVVVAGCKIRYLVWGDLRLPGIVLIHGGAAHAHWWSFLAPLLTNRYSVAALDLSGHGESGHRESYPRRIWADEVSAVIDAVGFSGPPFVVGHSMGGLVGIVTASVYGDKLAGAVIVDAPVRKPDPESESARRGQEFQNPKTYPDRTTAKSRFRLVPGQPCDNDFILDYIAEHSLKDVAEGVTWKFDPRVFMRV
jgi:pimeloyl-ACP methyl ester carboxylesterase